MSKEEIDLYVEETMRCFLKNEPEYYSVAEVYIWTENYIRKYLYKKYKVEEEECK